MLAQSTALPLAARASVQRTGRGSRELVPADPIQDVLVVDATVHTAWEAQACCAAVATVAERVSRIDVGEEIHSDQGSPYASEDHRKLLAAHDVISR
jgi:hypothetical protein